MKSSSYAHTKIALSEGMGTIEVETILSGISDDIPEEEKLAVLFAQHYVDERGNPEKTSWKNSSKPMEKNYP